jgi:hypothetical protein
MAFDWAGGTAGGLGGASTGAYLGSFGGPAAPVTVPLGALLGFLAGGAAGGFGGSGGTPGGIQQISNLTPEQQQYLPQLLQMAMQQYQNPYQGFGDIENDSWRQFNSSILPGIQERYNTGNDHYSSGPGQRAAYGAGADLQSRLASARAQFGQQNRQNALQTLLNPNYTSNFNRPGQQGFGETLLPYAAKAALGAGVGYAGNTDPKMLGKDILGGIGNAFQPPR